MVFRIRNPAENPWRFVLLLLFLYAALFFVFFPAFYSAIDEHEYAKNSILLSQGKLVDANPLDYCGGTQINGHYLSNYFLGKPIFLLPFVPLGLFGFFLAGLLIHFANAVILFFIFKRLKIDSRFVVLYLLFPAFVWSSRTLYPELLVLTLALAGTFFYLGSNKKEWFVAGILFGLTALVRYDAALLFVGFALVSLLKNRSRFVWNLAGIALVGIGILTLNTVLYGAPLNTSYGYSAGSFLTRSNPNFWNNFAIFAAILLVAYPLMLLSPLFLRKKFGLEVFLSALAVFSLFSRTTDISVFEFFSPLTVTGRMRYLVPLAGLLVIPYSAWLQGLVQQVQKRFRFLSLTRFLLIVTIILFVSAIVLSVVHQNFLQKREMVQQQLFAVVPENALVVGSSDDCIYFLDGLFGSRKYVRVDWQVIDVPQAIHDFSGPVFVMDLQYSNKSDSASRQQTIDRERQKIKDFIQQNQNRLSLVFETTAPHSLRIYRLNPT